MFLGFMALAARALLVQSVNKDFLQAEAEKRYSRKTELVATRGMITDRNGTPLATSPAVKTVTVNPTYYKKVLAELEKSQSEQLSRLPGKLVRLSDLLDIDLNTIERRLA
jgi:cell division protein FtsI (penicillin-binding protein 3)